MIYDITVKDSTTPLWNLPYEEQLQKKTEMVRTKLRKFKADLLHLSKVRGDKACLRLQPGQFGEVCTVHPTIPSPVIYAYRNKCEFSIGMGEDDKVTVGFRMPRFYYKRFAVAPPETCLHITQEMKLIAELCQQFLRTHAKFPPLMPMIREIGLWRTLTVRQSRDGSLMLLLHAKISPEYREEQLAEIFKWKDYMLNEYEKRMNDGIKASISTIVVQCTPGLQMPQEGDETMILHGKGFIKEHVGDLSLKISPLSFFQVNSAGIEKLFSVLSNWTDLYAAKKVPLLDLYCGTGTIGLSLSKHATSIAGIEIMADAVRDANDNAKANNVDNTVFICGKAEEKITSIMPSPNTKSKVIAIINPPRAGMKPQLRRFLQQSKVISMIFYVSCNLDSLADDLLNLCDPNTNSPFVPIEAYPVDMFPLTEHVETAVLLERVGN